MAHILNKYFDHIFVIAHPKSLRYTTFNQRWQGLEYKLAKFVKQEEEAWAKNNYAEHIFENIPNKIKLFDPLSTGQVCCAIAHMLIYKKIIDNKLNNVLILEDDSVFNDLSNLEIAIQSNWEILALFTAQCDLFCTPEQAYPYTNLYSKAGTSAYALKDYKTAENIFLNQITNMNTADGVLMRSNLNIYAVWPPVCSCDSSPSIIVHGLY